MRVLVRKLLGSVFSRSVGVGAGSAVMILWSGLESVSAENARYLLSTIAQTLAAILALSFALILVAAQQSSTYSRRLFHYIVDNVTIAYAALFLLAITTALWSLVSPDVKWRVQLACFLSLWSLLLLIPYAVRTRRRLEPSSFLRDLEAETRRLAHSESSDPAELLLQGLVDVAYSCIRLNDWTMLELTLRALARLAALPVEDASVATNQFAIKCIDAVERLALDNIEHHQVTDLLLRACDQVVNQIHRRTQCAIRLVEALGRLGEETCRSDRGGTARVANAVANIIGTVVPERSTDADVELVDAVVVAVMSIESAIRTDVSSSSQLLSTLGSIATKCLADKRKTASFFGFALVSVIERELGLAFVSPQTSLTVVIAHFGWVARSDEEALSKAACNQLWDLAALASVRLLEPTRSQLVVVLRTLAKGPKSHMLKRTFFGEDQDEDDTWEGRRYHIAVNRADRAAWNPVDSTWASARAQEEAFDRAAKVLRNLEDDVFGGSEESV